jgi:hypothetical protein
MDAAVGCLLGALGISSLFGFVDQQLPLIPLILVLTMSLAMLCLVALSAFAYETRFGKDGAELQFVFRKDHVPWESIEWHRNVGFKNRILGGANVWVILKYKQPTQGDVYFRKAVLFVAATAGPAVGISTKEFKTPFDSLL